MFHFQPSGSCIVLGRMQYLRAAPGGRRGVLLLPVDMQSLALCEKSENPEIMVTI